MIRFERVSVSYPESERPVLAEVSFAIAEGELCLLAGGTGSGKSTVLRAVNGLVPRFTGGTLRGRVLVGGRDTSAFPPRELADVVGVVGQDPINGFVTDTVEEELAYTMEQLAVPGPVMRKRVEETLDLLGIAELRHRPLRTLSGGQQQRVAIGAVLTAHPRILVLDEPTSALDPTAAEDVLSAITRLVHDLGVTVLVAEHRLERVVQYADRMLFLPGDGSLRDGAPAEILAGTPIAPPIVMLGRLAGWDPLPLSIRDARRLAGPLRDALSGAGPPGRAVTAGPTAAGPTTADPVSAGPVGLRAHGVLVRYGPLVAVDRVDLDLYAGQVLALMGRNGSGKSSLLWALQGSGARQGGTVTIGGTDPATLSAGKARALVGLVPQTPGDLLYLDTVAAECAAADRESTKPAGTCAALLARLTPDFEAAPGIAAAPGGLADRHPRDLSEGQRLALVLAVQLTAGPRVVLLDEPTRGLDYEAKQRFAATIRELAAQGSTVVLATHDVELVATVADRVVVLADGDLVADGPTAEIVAASPAFAPQVAKILAPQPWLTVADVERALR